ncbi:MAG: hypothetical protein ABI581_15385, partial [Sediminibacterium sp.]
DWVLQFQYDASLYAEALLRIAYLQSAPLFAMAATGKKNELLIRVKRMISKKENRFSYRKQLLSFLIVTGILSSIAWLNPMAPHTDKQHLIVQGSLSKKINQPYTVQPMAVSVGNPLFNPIFFLSEPLKKKIKTDLASAQLEINKAAMEYEGLAKQQAESITPMMADAMEKAVIEMAPQQIELEKSMATMELAKSELQKLNMNKLFRLDSLVPMKMRSRFKEDLNISLKKMEIDMKNAKTEMERSFKAGSEISFDKEKVQLGIGKAMEALEQLNKMGGLDNIVLNSLKIADLEINNNKPRQRMKQPVRIQVPGTPEEISKPRMRMPVAADGEKHEVIEITNNDLREIRMDEDAVQFTELSLERKLVSLLELSSIKLDETTIRKIKSYLLLQRAAEQGSRWKLIPAINKEKKDVDENRVIIQLQ